MRACAMRSIRRWPANNWPVSSRHVCAPWWRPPRCRGEDAAEPGVAGLWADDQRCLVVAGRSAARRADRVTWGALGAVAKANRIARGAGADGDFAGCQTGQPCPAVGDAAELFVGRGTDAYAGHG